MQLGLSPLPLPALSILGSRRLASLRPLLRGPGHQMCHRATLQHRHPRGRPGVTREPSHLFEAWMQIWAVGYQPESRPDQEGTWGREVGTTVPTLTGGGVEKASPAGAALQAEKQCQGRAASAQEAWVPQGARRVQAWPPPAWGPLLLSSGTWAYWLAQAGARMWEAPEGTGVRI